jgi:chromosomal replication initiation ATPase DnaA
MKGEDLQTQEAGPRLDMNPIAWGRCLRALESELPEQQFNTWVRPLHAVELPGALKLLAPNRFAVDWVRANLLPRLSALVANGVAADAPTIIVEMGSRHAVNDAPITTNTVAADGNGITCGGRAAHITAAASVGPRYDIRLTPAERKAAENGIGSNGGTCLRRDFAEARFRDNSRSDLPI